MGFEPAPSVMASGMGESMCAASYSLFSVLSRMTALAGMASAHASCCQPAGRVKRTVEGRHGRTPSFAPACGRPIAHGLAMDMPLRVPEALSFLDLATRLQPQHTMPIR